MKYGFNGTLLDDESAKIMRFYGFENNVCPRDIRDICAGEAEEIVLEINCDGGDLEAGLEIFSILRGYNGMVTAFVQSRAASAATVAMMGAGRIEAEPTALICIHNPTTHVRGEQKDMQGAADTLGSCKESILTAYAVRPTTDRETLSALMDRDVFITAQQALELGLVDAIAEANEDIRIVAAAGGVHFPTEKMIADYRAAMEAQNSALEDQNHEKKRQMANAFLARYR